MKIFHTNIQFFHISSQIFCHPLRQGSYQNFILLRYLFINLTNQIINLSLYWPDINRWVKKSCRTDNLFCPEHLMLSLIHIRSRRYKKHLINSLLKFIKIKRTVI